MGSRFTTVSTRSWPILRSTPSSSRRRIASTAGRSKRPPRPASTSLWKSRSRPTAPAPHARGGVGGPGMGLGVAYPRRFHPSMRELKTRIDDGRLGTLAHCSAEQNGPAGLFMDPAAWRALASEAPAGGMTAMGVHNLDAMIHLFGPIDEVYAKSLRRGISYDAEDTTSVLRSEERRVGK